jgi:hypothetical protein
MEITRFTKTGGPLTKRISLTEDGSLKSYGGACVMSRGFAERIVIDSIKQFGELIGGLTSDQAIALGTLRSDLPDKVAIATKQAINGHAQPDMIARIAANIIYRQASGLALVDFDTKGMPPEIKARLEELDGCWPALLTVLPILRTVANVKRVSTSAGIYRTDTGAPLAGSNGIHIYVAVKDASDIDRFIRTLHDRCWLAGLGWMMVGAGGQQLERSIVDRMVGAPERLVFEGTPVLDPPLGQDQEERRPIVTEGTVLDTVAACPPLTVLEKARLRELHAKAAYGLTGESAKARPSSSTSRGIRSPGAPACRSPPPRKSPPSNAMASCFRQSNCRSMTRTSPATPLPTCSPIPSASRARRWPIRSKASPTASARPRSCSGPTARRGSTALPMGALCMS